MSQIAEILKEKLEEDKMELLNKIGEKLRYPNLRVLDLSSVIVRKREKKEQVKTVLEENEVIPKEVYIQSQFEQRKHMAFNFTQDEIAEFIDKHFEIKLLLPPSFVRMLPCPIFCAMISILVQDALKDAQNIHFAVTKPRT